MAGEGGLEPPVAALTVRCLTNLATPQLFRVPGATPAILVMESNHDGRFFCQLQNFTPASQHYLYGLGIEPRQSAPACL